MQSGDVAMVPEDFQGLDQSVDNRQWIYDACRSYRIARIRVKQLAVAVGAVV